MDTQLLSVAARLSDHDLIARVKALAQAERAATAVLIAHLAVLDERRLYLAEGCSSLFSYCTQVLRLSEHAAYGRIEAARAARRFQIILEMLTEGSANLTTVVLLAPHLTPENCGVVLEAAKHRSRRQVEELVARLRPQPPARFTVRRLPVTRQAPDQGGRTSEDLPAQDGHALEADTLALGGQLLVQPALSTTRRAVVEPLAPQQYRIQFTASAETYEKLQLAQDLLRHQIPAADVAQIMDRALSVLLEALAKQKFAATNRPRRSSTEHQRELSDRSATQERRREQTNHNSGEKRQPKNLRSDSSQERLEGSRGAGVRSRYIPAEIKRKVWLRDGGRCAFIAAGGRRCTERGFLEFHHKEPYSVGGEATVENIELRCRAHNEYEAEIFFGPLAISRDRLTTAVKEAPMSYER